MLHIFKRFIPCGQYLAGLIHMIENPHKIQNLPSRIFDKNGIRF